MVNAKAQEAVQKSLDSVTGDKSTGVAGLVLHTVKGTQSCGPTLQLTSSGWLC